MSAPRPIWAATPTVALPGRWCRTFAGCATRSRADSGLPQRVRIGAAGGIGTPDAAAAAFMLGADFVTTGSINQCTPEAGISDTAKDMLAQADIADFDIAPAGDMFEIGAKVQVLKRGTLFASRANRLYELYRTVPGLDAIPAETRAEIEQRYLGRSIDAVWQETANFYAGRAPAELAEAEANPRKKMAMVFRWYFIHSSRLAIDGRADQRANFQIHSGPAMAAANRWLKGTPLEDWRRRHVDVLADRLMEEAAAAVRRTAARARRTRRVSAMRASVRRGFRGCDHDIVRMSERIVGMAHRATDHRMEAAGFLGIGEQLVHERHVRDRHVLGDRAQVDVGEADARRIAA